MVFGGIQKVTLLDYPGETACTIFTVGCDFACPFCQNASLLNERQVDGLGQEDVLCFLATRRGLLDGVCISGGEPLLQDELEFFIDEIKKAGFLVKIDTNGSDPKKLKRLLESGKIDYVAMDIKNSPEKYARTIGLPEYDITPIDESINLLLTWANLNDSKASCEFRTTVVKEYHTEDDLLSIARWISGTQKYFLQSFVDSDGVKSKGLHSYSNNEMQQIIKTVKTVLPTAELRGM